MKTPKPLKPIKKTTSNKPVSGGIKKKRVALPSNNTKLKNGISLGIKKVLDSPQSGLKNVVSSKKNTTKKGPPTPEEKLGLQIEAFLERNKSKLPSPTQKETPKGRTTNSDSTPFLKSEKFSIKKPSFTETPAPKSEGNAVSSPVKDPVQKPKVTPMKKHVRPFSKKVINKAQKERKEKTENDGSPGKTLSQESEGTLKENETTSPKAVNGTGPSNQKKKKNKSKKQKQKKLEELLKKKSRGPPSPIELAVALEVSKALFQHHAEVTKEKKELFDDGPQKIIVQVNTIKPAITARRIIRLFLPHPVIHSGADICMFVPDIKGKKSKPEVSEEFHEDLLKQKGVDNISEIIPMKKLKTDYSQYELKRKLAGRFDLFLADARIVHRIFPLLGKFFHSTSKSPVPVSLEGKVKANIKNALSKCMFRMTDKSTSFNTQIGTTEMSPEELADNISELCRGVNNCFPGAWQNIRSVYVKTTKTGFLPIYMSMLSRNKVKTPVAESKKKQPEPVEDELSTILGATVTVHPSGKVEVKKRKLEEEDDDDDDDEEGGEEKVNKKAKSLEDEEEENEVEVKTEESGAEEENEEEEPSKEEEEDKDGEETEIKQESDDNEEDEDEDDGDGGSDEDEDDGDGGSDEDVEKSPRDEADVKNETDSSDEEEIDAAEEEYLRTLQMTLPAQKAPRKPRRNQFVKSKTVNKPGKGGETKVTKANNNKKGGGGPQRKPAPGAKKQNAGPKKQNARTKKP